MKNKIEWDEPMMTKATPPPTEKESEFVGNRSERQKLVNSTSLDRISNHDELSKSDSTETQACKHEQTNWQRNRLRQNQMENTANGYGVCVCMYVSEPIRAKRKMIVVWSSLFAFVFFFSYSTKRKLS